jgi:hypothetical protein
MYGGKITKQNIIRYPLPLCECEINPLQLGPPIHLAYPSEILLSATGRRYLIVQPESGETLQSFMDRHAATMGLPSLLACILAIGTCLDKLHEAGCLHGVLSTETVRIRADESLRDFSVVFSNLDPLAMADISCAVHTAARKHPLNFEALYIPRNTRGWDVFCFGVLISELVRQFNQLEPVEKPVKAFTFDLQVIESFARPLGQSMFFQTIIQTMLPILEMPELSHLLENLRRLAVRLRSPNESVLPLDLTPKLSILYYNHCNLVITPFELPAVKRTKCVVCDELNSNHQWRVEIIHKD